MSRIEHMSNESELFRCVLNVCWRLAVQRAGSHPEEAEYQDEFGRTALHLACIPDPPVNVVTSLLDAFPGATSKKNKWGCTPLHFGCLYSQKEVVEALISTDLSAIFVTNEDNYTPLVHMCKWYDFIIRRAIRKLSTPSADPREVLRDDRELSRIWNNACLLVRAAYHGAVRDPLPHGKAWKIVHACAGVDDCPQVLLELAMKVHPEQLHEGDENGNLPLHIVSAANSLEKDAPSDDLLLVLSANPGAAKVPNKQGMFPLHRAIQNGNRWDGAVKNIFGAFPGAVTEMDKERKLWPFMQAAVGERASLDTIVHLLRACPELERFSNIGVSKVEFVL